MRRWIPAVCLALALSPSACGDDGTACGFDTECGSAQICIGADGAGGGVCTGVTTQTRRALDLVQAPAATFSMGCQAATDPLCRATEGPPHLVDVEAFAIERTEVTVRDFVDLLNAQGTVCGAGDCLKQNALLDLPVDNVSGRWAAARDNADHPMTYVTWHGAGAFCAWRGLRLCTEAEWERAARGACPASGDCDAAMRIYPWGNEEADCTRAYMLGDTQPGCDTQATGPVGSYPASASPVGALDMAGGVWEWVEDSWHADYTGAPTDGSAWADAGAKLRVIRGGGAADPHDTVRSAHRWNGGAGDGGQYRGFRCCGD